MSKSITRTTVIEAIRNTVSALWSAEVIGTDYPDEVDHSVAWAWIEGRAGDAELLGGVVKVRHPDHMPSWTAVRS